MEQRVSLITLGVRDLDQSRAFYERLGWRRSALNADEVAFFQVGGLVLSLVPRANLAKDAALSPAGSGFCGMVLAYNTRTKEVDGGR
jgi:catechol 2,3-dioxygenase-like lactoylglutathione lyase family enzyme